jgi:hypothetical protein
MEAKVKFMPSDLSCIFLWQTFSLSLVSLFHVTAGDPWPEEPALMDEDGTVNWRVCMFHMSYEISVNWVILQARKRLAAFGDRSTTIFIQVLKRLCSAGQRRGAPRQLYRLVIAD